MLGVESEKSNRMKKTKFIRRQTGCLCLFAFLLILPNVFAQEMTRQSGTIFDQTTKETLPGVNLLIKGTQRGTTTDFDGNYSLEIAHGETVVISYLGYKTKEVLVGRDNLSSIFLESSTHELGEVVVTALGIERNTRTLSYATQQLAGGEVAEIRDNSSNVLSSLSGKVSGAVITTAATGPGAAARVVLRGNRSISGNNNALIVIDGIPFDNSSPGQATGTSGGYGASDGAANINPDDIESINVLKGPSAAALYGSRAANGAIIITTKQGREGRFTLDYSGGVSMDQPVLLMNFQDSYGRGNGGVASATAGESWGEKAQTYPDNVKDFFETATSFNNAVSLYGGTKDLQGFASYTNNKVEGIVPGNDMRRNTVNVRVNTNFIPRLTTDTKITYMRQDIKNRPRLGDGGVPLEAYIMPRDMSSDELKDFETINPTNGQPIRKYWTTSSIYDNPYWNVYRTSVNEERNRITVLGSVKYALFDWLDVMGRVSYDRYDDKQTGSFYDGTVSLGDVKAGGKYYETMSEYWERNFDILFSGKHTINGVFDINYNLGASSLKRSYNTLRNMANGLTIPNQFSLAFATTPSFEKQLYTETSRNQYQRMLNSVYGSVQFGYNSYLYLDVTARNDWSSTLPAPHSYFYPSVGLSAVLTDMISMPGWVSFGKVRAAYAQVGNDADPYLLNQKYKFALGAGQGFISRDTNKSINDLKPEKTNSYELGLEWKFFENRFTVDMAFYKSNTKNQLLFVGLPMASGYNRRYINAGNIENKGFEIQLGARPVQTDHFSWQTGINFSTNSNKVIELAPNTTQVNLTENTKYGTVVVKEGSAYGDLYGFKWKRDEQTGKPIVDDKGLPVVESNQLLGNFNPDCLIGWTNSFNYKNFRLSFLIDGRIGGEMISGTDAYLAAYGLGDFTEKWREGGLILDAVKADGTTNATPIHAQQLWTTVSQNGRDAWGEFFTYDMTNFRLRELSFGYDFDLSKVSFIKAAQVSLTGRNLFFFYRGKAKLKIPGIDDRTIPLDPDAALGAGNYQGVEVGLPPATRSFGLNVKLTF